MNYNFKGWFLRQTQRERILPVPLSVAQQHLKIAFASPINISNDIFFSDYQYTGKVNDHEINVKFTVYGRRPMHYSMYAQLHPHPQGTRLVMTVKDETPILFLLAIVLLVIFFVLVRGGGGAIFAAFFLLLLNFPLLAWHRNSAADSISALLDKIVSKQP